MKQGDAYSSDMLIPTGASPSSIPITYEEENSLPAADLWAAGTLTPIPHREIKGTEWSQTTAAHLYSLGFGLILYTC